MYTAVLRGGTWKNSHKVPVEKTVKAQAVA